MRTKRPPTPICEERNESMITRALVVLVAGLVIACPPLGAAEPVTPPGLAVVHGPPAGEFRTGRITLEGLPHGGGAQDYHLDGGFRGGRMPVISRHSHRDVAGHLNLTGDKVAGSVAFGRAKNGSMRSAMGMDFQLVIDAAVAADGTVSGTYSGKVWPTLNLSGDGKSVSGKVSGFVRTEAQLAALQQGFAAGADWPTWAGPNGGLRATPTGVALVDDLAKARLIWRSEETTPQGPGSLYTMRSPGDALTSRTGGGGSSPIVADGRVFLNYYEPNAASGLTITDFGILEKLWNQKVTAGEWTVTPMPNLTREKLYPRADQVMLCIDAMTGKTLWKTVIPNAGINNQSHKTGPMNCTAYAGGGRVMAMDNGGRLNAMDARTGQFLWSAKLTDAKPSTRGFNQAVTEIGGVVIAGDQGSTLVGIESATGKTLWTIPEGTYSTSAMAVPWTANGKAYALSLTAKDLKLIDPATGRVVWAFGLKGSPGKHVVVFKDLALLFKGVAEQNASEDERQDPGKDPLTCVAIQLAVEQATERWAVPCPWSNGNIAPIASAGGLVCTAGGKEARLFDVVSGKPVAACPVPTGPFNEGMVESIEDRFLMTQDGSHGAQGVSMVPAAADGFRQMGQQTLFRHLQTCSYHNMPMTRAYVDGRLFIRGMDGIYCYDLRATAR